MDPIWPAHASRLGDKRIKPFLDYGDKWNEFSMFLGRFKETDELEVIVRKKSKKASLPQNRYYYGVIVKIISDFTGHTTDEVDNQLKWKFLKQIDERGQEYVPSKMDLSTTDREAFHEKCRRWGAVVLELNIPLPGEYEV
jgi:hypothetical protein